MIYELGIEVHCFRPTWVYEENNTQYTNPSYRIYINNDLVIERNWVWTDTHVITENILVELPKGGQGNLLKTQQLTGYLCL